mmetsp:Transcript_32208/g.51257  ORF Transcript_32208/g.51257 Transcript_32208/m.51257 type:complete len:1524 (+) Transcript_32208:142-4713(+)
MKKSQGLLSKLEERDLLTESEKLTKRRNVDGDEDVGPGDTQDRDMKNAKKLFKGGNMFAQELEENKQLTAEDIVKKNPDQIFLETDTDHSGLIEMDEFLVMLPQLGIDMTEAKALRYFKDLDVKGTGALDYDEFRAALYACDPTSGNTIGFQPSSYLSPKDAFKMFDNGTGQITDDDMSDVLDYLGFQIDDAKQEKLFKRHDKEKNGFLEYGQFRRIWLSVCDLRVELELRSIEMPKRAPKAVMMRRLEEHIEEEEMMEEHSLAQAKAWREWQKGQEQKKGLVEKAKKRAREELIHALDIAGQVYVFGVGPHGQFSADAARPTRNFKNFEVIQSLWQERVAPKGRVEIKHRNVGQVRFSYKKRTPYPTEYTWDGKLVPRNEELQYDADDINDLPGREEEEFSQIKGHEKSSEFRFPKRSSTVIDKIIRGADFPVEDLSTDEESEESEDEVAPPLTEEEQMELVSQELANNNKREGGFPGADIVQDDSGWVSPFTNVVCALNTAAIWGRRIVTVTASINTIFALTDSGEILAWGGRDQWWQEINPRDNESKEGIEDRGILTHRSELLLGLRGKQPWPDISEPQLDLGETENELYCRLQFVTSDYYNVWEPCPFPHLRMQHMEHIILPRVSFKDVFDSLEIRGFECTGMNKRQMIDKLHSALMVEKQVCGVSFMKKIREAELEIAEIRKASKKTQPAELIEMAIKQIWRPLHPKVQANEDGKEHAHSEMRRKREALHYDQYIQWRNSLSNPPPRFDKRKLPSASIITERGDGPKMFFSKSVGYKSICAGSFHMAAVTKRGKVFTWGDGNYGRLGQGPGEIIRSKSIKKKKMSKKEADALKEACINARHDTDEPTRVEDIRKLSIQDVACGYSHTACVTKTGAVYVWGGATDGKLGLGPVTGEYECYCPYPILLPFKNRPKIAQVSCGNAHTGAVCEMGNVFMWGCTDSGRLGLGPDVIKKVVDTPTIVRALQTAGVKVKQVSCGCSHTVICTVTSSKTVEGTGASKIRKVHGGIVYVAGPASVLGKPRPRFHLVRELANIPVAQVSAGFGITACCSVEGEVYSWGANKGGCIGHPLARKFIRKPKLVKCLYTVPKNLAFRRKTTRQSSVYNSRTSECAVNGDTCGNGEHMCIHTQVDSQPFWEVDLGRICVIERIQLWNREDSPPDSALEPDAFTSRLFPCWIMLSAIPFDRALVNAYSSCAAKKKFTKNVRRTVWNVPPNTAARYVRVQLEGTNYLHFAECQVFGSPGLEKCVGKISSVTCGKEVMVAISQPSIKLSEVEDAYTRAVKADPANATTLRQYPTYFTCWDKYGYGEKILKCPLDKGSIKCEICVLKHNCEDNDFPPGPGGRIRRLDSIGKILLDSSLPPMNYEIFKGKTEGVVANVLKSMDSMKSFFNKSSTKLLCKKVAKEKFDITLQDLESGGSEYLLEQFQELKEKEAEQKIIQEEEKKEEDKQEIIRRETRVIEEEDFNFACILCDICPNFEPLLLNPHVCTVCTHTKALRGVSERILPEVYAKKRQSHSCK